MASRLTKLNGVTVAYVMGLANAALALVVAFGVNLTPTQQGTITALVNAFLVLVAHASYTQAKNTKQVIPAGPIDESQPKA